MAASDPNSRAETSTLQSFSYFGSTSDTSPTENNPFAFASGNPPARISQSGSSSVVESHFNKVPQVDNPTFDPYQTPQQGLPGQQSGGSGFGEAAGAAGFFDMLPPSQGVSSMLWPSGPPPSHESPLSPSVDPLHSQGPPPSHMAPPSSGPPPSQGTPPSHMAPLTHMAPLSSGPPGPPPSQGPPPSHGPPPSQGTSLSQGPPPSQGTPPSHGPPPSQGPPPSHGTASRDLIEGESPWGQSNPNTVSPDKRFPDNDASAPHHVRQSSLPPPAAGLFRSTDLKEDFFSAVQPQSFPSFQPPNTGTPQALGESLHTQQEAQTSVSVPATGLIHVLPQEQAPQQLTQSSGPISLPAYQHTLSSSSSEHRGSQDSSSSFPRPLSNADLHLTSGGLLMGGTTDYPFTNADLVPSVSLPSTNAPHPVINEEHRIKNEATTHHHTDVEGDTATNFESHNMRVTHEVDYLPTLSSPLNQSMSSLLDSSQEDFTSHSPIRLLPPAPDQSSVTTFDMKPAVPMVDPRFPVPSGSGVNSPNLLQTQPDPPLVRPEINMNEQGNGSFKDWEIIEDASQIPVSDPDASQVPVSDPVVQVPAHAHSVSSVSTASYSTDTVDQVSLLGRTESERENASPMAPQVVSEVYPPLSSQPQGLPLQAPPPVQSLQQTQGPPPQAPPPVQSLQQTQGLPPRAPSSVQSLHGLPPQAPPPVHSLQRLPPQAPSSVQSLQGLPPQAPPPVHSLQGLPPQDSLSVYSQPLPGVPTLAPPTSQVGTQLQSSPQTNEETSTVGYLHPVNNPGHPAASDPSTPVTLVTATPSQHPEPVASTSTSTQQLAAISSSQLQLPASAPLVVLPPVGTSVQQSSNPEPALSTPATCSTMATAPPPATERIQQVPTVHNPAPPPISTSSGVGGANPFPTSGTQTHTPQSQATTMANVETTAHPPPPHTTHPPPAQAAHPPPPHSVHPPPAQATYPPPPHTHTAHSESTAPPAEVRADHPQGKMYPDRPHYVDEDYRLRTGYYHDDHYRHPRDDPYQDPRDRHRHPSGHHHPTSHDMSHDPRYPYPPHPPSHYNPNQYRNPYDDPYYHHRGYDRGPYGSRYRGDRYHRPHPDERYNRPHPREPYDPYDPHYDQRSEYESSYYGTEGYGNEYPSRDGYGAPDYYQRGYDHHPDPQVDYGHPELSGHHKEAGAYESEQYVDQQVTHQEEFDPAETSAIPGHMDNYEVGGTFINSPQAGPSQWSQETPHDSAAYFDPPALSYGDEWEKQSGVVYAQAEIQPHGEDPYGNYSHEGYGTNDYQGGYPGYTGDGYAHEHAYGATENQQYNYNNQSYDVAQPWEPIQPTPPPQRQTPELFVHPHVRASFGFGGQLVTVLPNSVMRKQSLSVEISEIKDLVEDTECKSFTESVNSFPGPFMLGSTPKNLVVQYATCEAQKVRDRVKVILESRGDSLEVKQLEDEVLLWEFLVLLCQQNGVILPTDISDLLMKDLSLSVNSSLHLGAADREEALGTLRSLLLAGQRKDALDLACSKSLWGHALMLASNMDESSRNYVVNRFTASLMSTDPLGTFYTLLLGRMPSSVKVDGLQRAGDWRPHLAMILANKMSKLDNTSIVSLGEALHNQGRLNAAHLCYFLGSIHFGGYGDQDSKYSLFGVDQSELQVGNYPCPDFLRKMEVFEYAMSLSKQEFSLPSFQTFKFLHVLKLLEAGYVSKALKYCEQISLSVVKGPKHYTPVLLNSLVDLSIRLHHLNSPFGIVENELPVWLSQVDKCVGDVVSSDYTPHLFSPSPAFSSVSQTYSGNQQAGQPMAGLQGFLTVPSSGGSVKGGSELSSKEGSVVNMQLPSSTQTNNVHQLEMFATSQTVAEQQQSQVQTFPSGQQLGEPSQYNQLQGQPSTSTLVSENPVEGQGINPPQGNLASSYPPQQAGTLLMGEEGIDGGNTYQQQHNMYYGLQPPGQQQEVGGGSSQGEQVQSGMNMGVGETGDIPQADHVTEYALQNQGSQFQLQQDLSQQNPSSDYGMLSYPTSKPQSQPTMTFDPNNQPQAHPGVTFDPNNQPQAHPGVTFDPNNQPQPNPVTTFDPNNQSHAYPTMTFDPHSVPQSQSYWQGAQQQGLGGTVPPQSDQYVGMYEGQRSSEPTENKPEFSQKTEAESVGSHDSHMTKKENEHEDVKESETTAKEGNNDKKESGGGGWGFNILKYIIPKRKNQAHLPDDKKKSIYWDDKLKKWIDETADVQDEKPPPPPPSDSQLNKSVPPQPTSTTFPPSHRVTEATDGSDGVTGPPGNQPNLYSRQGSKRGRLGARSKYVDVLNPGGTTRPSSEDTQPPPPPGLLGGTSLLGGQQQPFPGTFFVPQQPAGDPDAEPTDPTTIAPSSQETYSSNQANLNPTSQESQSQPVGYGGQHVGNPSGQREHRESGQQSSQFTGQEQSGLVNQPPTHPQSGLGNQPPLQQQSGLGNQPPLQQQSGLGSQPPLQQQSGLGNQPPLQQQSGLGNQPPLQQQSGLGNQPPLQQQSGLGNQPPLQQQSGLGNQPPLQQQSGLGNQPPLQQQSGLGNQPPLQSRGITQQQYYTQLPLQAQGFHGDQSQQSSEQLPQSYQHNPQSTRAPSTQSVPQSSGNTTEQQPPHHPQFFNPSAFAPVSGLPSESLGAGPMSEQQDDTLSTVSLMSEASQEVNSYMGKPRTTMAAGRHRLRQGVHGNGGYPTNQIPTRQPVGQAPPASNQAPPLSGPPQMRMQNRQQWQ